MGLNRVLFGFCAVLLLVGVAFGPAAILTADGPEPAPIPYSTTLVADGVSPVPNPWLVADGVSPVPNPWLVVDGVSPVPNPWTAV